MSKQQIFDVAVVGAGVFGAWTAYELRRSGAEVILIDAYGPGNSRSSSGGESRMIRMGYGPDEIYTRMAQHSLLRWRELFDNVGATRLFQSSGILWLARAHDPYCLATLETLQRCGVRFERLDQPQLAERYPQLELDEIAWAVLEPESGVLLARQAVQAVVARALAEGVTYVEEAAILSPQHAHEGSKLDSLQTLTGRSISAPINSFSHAGPGCQRFFPRCSVR
jgi:sarcosine oxidase